MMLGLGHLKLSPENFWAMTAAELLTALGVQTNQPSALSRAEMEKLIHASGEKNYAAR